MQSAIAGEETGDPAVLADAMVEKLKLDADAPSPPPASGTTTTDSSSSVDSSALPVSVSKPTGAC